MVTVCALALTAGVIGCASESAPAPDPDPATAPDDPFEHPEPSPYDPDLSSEELTASFGTAEAGALIEDMLLLVQALDAQTLLQTFADLNAQSDDSCPNGRTVGTVDGGEGSVVLWINDQPCTSESGVYFGPGVAQRLTVVMPIQDGITQDTEQVFAQYLDLQGSDGSSVRGGFVIDRSTYILPDDTGFVHALYYEGTVQLDATNAGQNPWLNGEATGELILEAIDTQGVRSLKISGSLQPPEGSALSAIEFHQLGLDNVSCAKTFGSVSLRDLNGGWHDVDFGGEFDPATTCDACGELSFDGEPLGEACSDEVALGQLLNWETTPW